MTSRTATVLGVIFAMVAVAALALNAVVGGGDPQRLRAGFDDAIQMTPGQEVRLAGRAVGAIERVELIDGRAAVELSVTDEDAWPLPKGTTARARWGSTTAYLGRYIELVPGPEGAGALADGAILPAERNETAFELDEAYRLLRGRTKDDTGTLVDRLGGTFGDRQDALRAGVAAAPGGLDEVAALTRELGADEERLRTLAEEGDKTVSTLAARERELGDLLVDAASTFTEFAEHTRAQQRGLEKAPATFRTSTSVLERFDETVEGLDALMVDLAPGAPALRRLAGTARGTLRELRAVAPLAASTLARGTAAAPALERFFDTATPLLPQLGQAFAGLTPTIDCLRPYAPEIAGFLTTWTGQTKNFDAVGHYARSFPLTVIPALLPGTSNTAAQAVRQQPRLRYALPRPPGLNAGTPQLRPECGAGADALDPTKDPELTRK